MENFLDGGLGKLHTDDQDQHGHQQPGQVFHTRVAVRMLLIGGTLGQLKAEQRYKRGRGIGEVVHSVGSDGDGTRQCARNELSGKEQEVAHQPHQSGKPSVSAAHLGIIRISKVFDK